MTISHETEDSPTAINTVTHCIFDVDGLLLDTESLKVTQNILDEFAPGKIYTWNVKAMMLGRQREDVAKRIVEIYNLPITWQHYVKLAQEYSKVFMENCSLMPGAERLIRHLHANNIPICLATSSSKESMEVKTKHHRKLFSLFQHKVMGSSEPEVKHGKPAPDIYLLAAKRFSGNPKPESCLAFEDAPNGCRAARSAGMRVVMVPNPHIKTKINDASIVLGSLLDFNPEDFGLPPFKDEDY